MTKSWKKTGLMFGLLFLVLALVIGSCAPAAPVEQEKKVKVGLSFVMTGPIATTGEPLSTSALSYLRYVNDELGGIEYTDPSTGNTEHVEMDLLWDDNAYNVAKALSIYKRHKAAGVMIMWNVGAMVDGLIGLIERDRIPITATQYTPYLVQKANLPYVLSDYPHYIDLHCAFLDWLKREWTLARPLRVGVITLDTISSRAFLNDGSYQQYAANLGMEWVGEEYIPVTVTDSTIELSRLGAKGADWVTMLTVTGSTTVVLKDAVRLGIKDKIGWVLMPYGIDEGLADLIGGTSEGVYGISPYALINEDLPGVRFTKQVVNKYRPGAKLTSTHVAGVPSAMVLAEVLRIALEKVGYENLTTAAITEGLHSISNFDTGGLCPPVTTTPESLWYNSYIRVVVMEKGEFKPVSDWLECPRVLKF